MRALWRLPAVLTISLLLGLVGVQAASATTAPTARITSPTSGSSVTGAVHVTASGTADASTDGTDYLYLYVDGDYLDDASCNGSGTCSATFTWDTTGLSGSHTLKAQLETVNGDEGNSSVITVSVASAVPHAQITTPTAGSSVTGQVSVHATGTIDASQSDSAEYLYLYVDGQYLDDRSCGGPNPKSCSVTFTWDTTGLSGTHSLQAELATVNGLSADSATVNVTVGSAAPQVQITSPSAGDSVTGKVSVRATGTIDASQSDSAEYLYLYVDGEYLDDESCGGPNPKSCSGTFTWDTTGLTGTHSLQAELATVNGLSVDSPTVDVTVGSAAPTVEITSPSSGDTVNQSFEVAATGTIDPSQSDSVGSIDLYVDGDYLDEQTCEGPDSRSCPVTFEVDGSSLSGEHTLQVELQTVNGLSVDSETTSIYVHSPTQVTLTSLAAAHSGSSQAVRGHVTATNDDAPAAGMPITVTFRPVIGASKTVTTRTNDNGDFTTTFHPSVNMTVTVAAAPSQGYAASSASQSVRVLAPFSCKLGASRVKHGVYSKGSCAIANLPAGTSATVQYLSGGVWHTLAKGTSDKGSVSFSYRFGKAGNDQLRVTVGTSKPYVASIGPAMKVTIT